MAPSAVQKRIRVQALTIVRNRSKPLRLVAPRVRLIAIEGAQESVGVFAREHRLDLGRQRDGRRGRPGGRQARVDEQQVAL